MLLAVWNKNVVFGKVQRYLKSAEFNTSNIVLPASQYYWPRVVIQSIVFLLSRTRGVLDVWCPSEAGWTLLMALFRRSCDSWLRLI